RAPPARVGARGRVSPRRNNGVNVALCTLFGAQRHVHTFPQVLDPQELILLGQGAPGMKCAGEIRRDPSWRDSRPTFRTKRRDDLASIFNESGVLPNLLGRTPLSLNFKGSWACHGAC